jgi:hypothetical protein
MNARRTLLGIALAATASLGLASCAGAPSVSETAVIRTDDLLLPQYEGEDPQLNPYAGTTANPDPNEGAVPITVFDATVEKVYVGDAEPGQSLKVMQPGGTMDGVEYVVEGITRLTSGSSVLLFLGTYPDAASAVLGGDVGAFTANGDSFTSIDNDSKLTISVTELSKL